MTDYIVRATAADSQIRAFAATTREMTEYARKVHEESPVACAALGRLMTAGAMMGAMMKGDKDLLTLQIRADGSTSRHDRDGRMQKEMSKGLPEIHR